MWSGPASFDSCRLVTPSSSDDSSRRRTAFSQNSLNASSLPLCIYSEGWLSLVCAGNRFITRAKTEYSFLLSCPYVLPFLWDPGKEKGEKRKLLWPWNVPVLHKLNKKNLGGGAGQSPWRVFVVIFIYLFFIIFYIQYVNCPVSTRKHRRTLSF